MTPDEYQDPDEPLAPEPDERPLWRRILQGLHDWATADAEVSGLGAYFRVRGLEEQSREWREPPDPTPPQD